MPYVTLEASKRYLKPIDELVDDPEDGMTQSDLDAAERFAKNLTDGKVGWQYDITTWEDDTPGLIEFANDLIASGKALEFYLNRDTDITFGAEFEPDKLQAEGIAFLEEIGKGKMELMDRNGAIIERKMLSPRQGVRHRESDATFYPDRQSDRSFGLPPRYSAERTFKRT